MWHVAIGIWPLPTTGGGRRWSDFDSKFADLHWFTIMYAIKPGPSLTTTGGRQRWGSDGNVPYWQHTKIKRFGLDTSLSMPDHRLPPPVVSNGESQPVSFGASFEFPECPCICTMQCQLSFSLPFTSLCPTFSMSQAFHQVVVYLNYLILCLVILCYSNSFQFILIYFNLYLFHVFLDICCECILNFTSWFSYVFDCFRLFSFERGGQIHSKTMYQDFG